METKRSLFLSILALLAALHSHPVFAAEIALRDQGLLTENEKEAIRSMQALMGNRADAQYAIGRIFERGGLEREARTWIQKSAHAGYVQAKLWIAEQQMKAAFRGDQGRMLVSSRRAMAGSE
ncbi:MAG: hypothetical protein HQL43_09930 [Alphaproteobacteria bacterium]|nr:hypothetical protein [Alphaproteobacteria bacterium]